MCLQLAEVLALGLVDEIEVRPGAQDHEDPDGEHEAPPGEGDEESEDGDVLHEAPPRRATASR